MVQPPQTAVNMMIFVILTGGVLLGFREVRREWLVARSQLALSRGDLPGELGRLGRDPRLPPRAFRNMALLWARAARGEIDPQRRRYMLAQARDSIERAERARPHWGEATTISAYISLLDHGANDARTRAVFSRSLEEAGYLRGAADWRISYGTQQWSWLDRRARRRVLNEAVWISQMSASDARRVRSFITNADARAALDRALAR